MSIEISSKWYFRTCFENTCNKLVEEFILVVKLSYLDVDHRRCSEKIYTQIARKILSKRKERSSYIVKLTTWRSNTMHWK